MYPSLEDYYFKMGICPEVSQFASRIEKEIASKFKEIDENAQINQMKVIMAMQKENISESHLNGTTGYGYDDLGRDSLERVYAHIFHTEDALVRPQITCGTHALAIALFGNLRPGDELLSPCGKPYNTLEEIIGIRASKGSLAEYNITYRQVDLIDDQYFDWDKIRESIHQKTKLVTIQRSRGYATRDSFTIEEIRKLISFIKEIKPELMVMVDNCYGEFVEPLEPTDVGADMVVGSLIKNPGGGLAPLGGYLAGKADLIENAAYRLNSPGLGKEVGATLDINRKFYQGLFMAPLITANALKTVTLASALYEQLGYEVSPKACDKRTDIIQSISLKQAEAVIAFCQGIQKGSPIDAHVTPYPAPMPGYDCDVIMAAGAFVSGSSIELSADAPMKEPYQVYLQGGLTFEHGKLGLMQSIEKLLQEGIITKEMLYK